MWSRIIPMKRIHLLMLALALISCQPQTSTPAAIRIIDGQTVLSVQPTSQNAAAILADAGLTLGPADKLYFNGFEVPADYTPSPGAGGTFQIRRAVEVTLVTPDGQTKFQSAALTVGQAVAGNGLTLYANDFLSPLAGTPLTAPVTVTYRPAPDRPSTRQRYRAPAPAAYRRHPIHRRWATHSGTWSSAMTQ